MKRYWTQEEYDFMEEKWGVISIKQIANHLCRSEKAVKCKAIRIGLSDARLNINGITINALSAALNIEYATINKVWIPNHAFPVKSKVVAIKQRVKYVEHKDFWKWAEKNKNLINFSKVEENILGQEPGWVKEARKVDFTNIEKRPKTAWTDEEINRLISLVKLHKYTGFEIASIIGRSEKAVQKKLWELKIKDRPVETENRLWEQNEIKIAVELKSKGYGINVIVKELGRTGNSVRGLLSRVPKEVAI